MGNVRPPPDVFYLSESRRITATWPPLEAETPMLAGDYNGWADVPEEEREALEALDLTIASRLERRRRPRPALPVTKAAPFARAKVFAAAA